MNPWLLAARPKTLTAAGIPVLVATSLAWVELAGQISLVLAACALFSAMAIQVATNFLNDAIDFKKGADNEKRIGPQRVTQSGLLTYRQVFALGLGFLLLAVIFGLPLVIKAGWPILLLGLVSVFLAYGYTGGPFPLAYLGLGDVFVFIFFGLAAVLGLYFVLVGHLSWVSLVAGAQLGFLSTVLIAINNLRDVDQDRPVNKKTLAVRFGQTFVRSEITVLLVAALAFSFFWWAQGYFWAAALPLITGPLAFKLGRGIWTTPPSPQMNSYLGLAALQHVLFGVLLSLGILLK